MSTPRIIHRGSGTHRAMLVAAAIGAALVIVWTSRFGTFNRGQITRVMIYAIAISGLNIATGYTGLVSVGHSAFFGLGAYTTGVLVVKYGWRAEWTIPVALVVCFAVGLVVGLPALRIRGLYLAIVTIAFGVAFPEVITHFESLTGGSQGLTIRRAMLVPPTWTGFVLREKDKWLFWLSVALLLLVLVVVHNLARSRWGLALMAARDNELAASASGVNLAAVKTVSFGVSGAITGVGGCLFAMYLGSLGAHDSFTLINAIALLTGLVIGGEATRFGPVIGGLAVVFLPYYTSDLGKGQASAVLFGAILIAIIFIAPQGLAGGIVQICGRFFRVVPRPPAGVTVTQAAEVDASGLDDTEPTPINPDMLGDVERGADPASESNPPI